MCITWCGFGPVVSGYAGSGSADRRVLGAGRCAALVSGHLGRRSEPATASGAPGQRAAWSARARGDRFGRGLLDARQLMPRDNVLGRTAVQVTGHLPSSDAGSGVTADHPPPCNLGRLTGQYPLKTTTRGQFGLPGQPGNLRVDAPLVTTSGRPRSSIAELGGLAGDLGARLDDAVADTSCDDTGHARTPQLLALRAAVDVPPCPLHVSSQLLRRRQHAGGARSVVVPGAPFGDGASDLCTCSHRVTRPRRRVRRW